ncbi:Lrp/AsnC family transcriptional regulator, partial [Streptomyces vietnamensis]
MPVDGVAVDVEQVSPDVVRTVPAPGPGRWAVPGANAYARINRLIDDGVIRGFSARVN